MIKKISIAFLLIIILFTTILITYSLPVKINKSYEAYEYESVQNRKVQVNITGKYYRKIFKYNEFIGQIYVEGYGNLYNIGGSKYKFVIRPYKGHYLTAINYSSAEANESFNGAFHINKDLSKIILQYEYKKYGEIDKTTYRATIAGPASSYDEAVAIANEFFK